MNLEEALKEIKNRVKPYLHVGMTQSTFAGTVKNIELGVAKPGTVEIFMSKFGYTLIRKEEEWKKS